MDITRIEKLGRLFSGLMPIPFLMFGAIIFFLGMSKFGFNINSMPVGQALIFMPLMLITIIGSGILGSLFGCLLFYCLSAWLLCIPRSTMETILSNAIANDPLEQNTLSQRYYKWCLDRAYGQKI